MSSGAAAAAGRVSHAPVALTGWRGFSRCGATAPLALLASFVPAQAAPDGTMTWGVHVTLVKPMPGNIDTPSLAESFSVSETG